MTGLLLVLGAASVSIRCKGPVEYDGKCKLLFRDEVRLEADDLRLECDALTAELDSKNSPVRVNVEGETTAAADWFEGSSAGAEYEIKTCVLRLSGPLRMLLRLKEQGKGKGKEKEQEKPKEKPVEKTVKIACSRRALLRRIERTGHLEGACVVEIEGATLYCDELEFAYSDEEETPLLRACASNARVEMDNRRGRAKKASFDAKKGTIDLEGDPVLEQDGASITAPGMRMHLKDRRVVALGGEFKVLTK